MSRTMLRAPISLLLVTLTAGACGKDAAVRRDRLGRNAAAQAIAPAPAADSVAAFELAPRNALSGMAVAAQPRPASAPEPPEVVPGSMLVRTGQASLQVDSLEIGVARVRDVARRTGAVIANTSMEGGRHETRAASLELRIPSEHFDEAVNGLAPIGKLESVNVSVQDVGEEFVDVQARVANARRLEQRLVDLLATRTGKLADVLSVERELARVREQIERYEGWLRYLRTRASISTLTIAVHEPYPIVADHPGASPIRDAFVQAWRNLVAFTAGFIALLGVLVPLGAIAGAIFVIGRRVLLARSFRLAPPRTPETDRA
jgi:hypothetical protein